MEEIDLLFVDSSVVDDSLGREIVAHGTLSSDDAKDEVYLTEGEKNQDVFVERFDRQTAV